jgi:hypothetical protein
VKQDDSRAVERTRLPNYTAQPCIVCDAIAAVRCSTVLWTLSTTEATQCQLITSMISAVQPAAGLWPEEECHTCIAFIVYS